MTLPIPIQAEVERDKSRGVQLERTEIHAMPLLPRFRQAHPLCKVFELSFFSSGIATV